MSPCGNNRKPTIYNGIKMFQGLNTVKINKERASFVC